MQKSILYKKEKVVYQKLGTSNKVIMLVHGFPEDGTIFKFQYEYLQADYTVIVADLPGSGASSYNAGLKTVEDFAEVLHAILTGEEVEKCHLLGHSMGGYISLAFAEKFPERLLGLGLLHSTAFADSEEKKENRQRSIDLMEKYGSYQFLKTVIPNLFGENFKLHHQRIIDDLIEKGKTFETKALQQYYFIMILRKDRTEILKNLSVPVLFIIGEQDTAIAPKDVLQQVSLPQISVVKILSNAAHMGFLEDRNVVNETVGQWLVVD